MFLSASKKIREIFKGLNVSESTVAAFFILASICYAPRLGGVDFGSLFAAFFGGFGFFHRLKSKKRIFWTEAFFGYLLLYSFILFASAGLGSWREHGYYFLRLARISSLYYVFYLLYFKLNLSVRELLKLLFATYGLHFLLVYCQYFPPLEWRTFFLKLNPVFDPQVNMNEFTISMLGGKRVKGAMMGFDGAGILIAYTVALGLVLFKGSLQRMLLLCAGLVGVIITSRTGGILLVGMAFFYFTRQFFMDRKTFWRESLGMSTALIVFIPLIFVLYPQSNFVTKSIRTSFELIYNYRETGRARIDSLNDLVQNHFVVSKSDLSFFGRPERQVANVPTEIHTAAQSDCGYLQVLANFGLPNTLLIVGVHLLLMALVFWEKRTLFDVRIIALAMFLIASIKGPYFFGRMTYDFILFIFFFEHIKSLEPTEKNRAPFLYET